jgi:hypothetical protein
MFARTLQKGIAMSGHAQLSTVALSASVLLSLLSFRISESNAALACFDASIDANLEGKLL